MSRVWVRLLKSWASRVCELAWGVVVAVILSGCVAAPVYQGPESDHFDGTRFHNSLPNDKSVVELLTAAVSVPFQMAEWEKPVNPPVAHAMAARHQQPVITYINHATVLVQVAGLNILTDPVFSERVSPFAWFGPRRIMPPAIPIEALPPIDVVLISHNHYDHLDLPSLKTLQARQKDNPPLLLTGLGNAALLTQEGLGPVKELDWEASHTVAPLEFVFTEVRHRSGRGAFDQMRTLWGAFVIRSPGGNLYFAGDTAYGPHFRETGDRHGPFVCALLPIGAYEPRWFMQDIHLNPNDAVKAHKDLRSQKSVGIHFGFFQLTTEGREAPEQDLRQALVRHKLRSEDFHVPYSGEQVRPAADVLRFAEGAP